VDVVETGTILFFTWGEKKCESGEEDRSWVAGRKEEEDEGRRGKTREDEGRRR
jgi:hypothetical protein